MNGDLKNEKKDVKIGIKASVISVNFILRMRSFSEKTDIERKVNRNRERRNKMMELLIEI
jgi:hypothetical protein